MKKWHLLLALAALLALVPASAMAQFSSPVCDGGSPVSALDPSYPANNADSEKECKRLCGIQGEVCAKVANKQTECAMHSFRAFVDGEKIDCNDEIEPGACRSDVSDSRRIVLGSLKTELNDQRSDCKSYLQNCVSNCGFDVR